MNAKLRVSAWFWPVKKRKKETAVFDPTIRQLARKDHLSMCCAEKCRGLHGGEIQVDLVSVL